MIENLKDDEFLEATKVNFRFSCTTLCFILGRDGINYRNVWILKDKIKLIELCQLGEIRVEGDKRPIEFDGSIDVNEVILKITFVEGGSIYVKK